MDTTANSGQSSHESYRFPVPHACILLKKTLHLSLRSCLAASIGQHSALLPASDQRQSMKRFSLARDDSQAICDFIGTGSSIERVSNVMSLLRFHSLLEQHALSRWVFKEINVSLAEKGLFMCEGTIVDATFVAADQRRIVRRFLGKVEGGRVCED